MRRIAIGEGCTWLQTPAKPVKQLGQWCQSAYCHGKHILAVWVICQEGELSLRCPACMASIRGEDEERSPEGPVPA